MKSEEGRKKEIKWLAMEYPVVIIAAAIVYAKIPHKDYKNHKYNKS